MKNQINPNKQELLETRIKKNNEKIKLFELNENNYAIVINNLKNENNKLKSMLDELDNSKKNY